jgi:hypothetical protein
MDISKYGLILHLIPIPLIVPSPHHSPSLSGAQGNKQLNFPFVLKDLFSLPGHLHRKLPSDSASRARDQGDLAHDALLAPVDKKAEDGAGVSKY